MPRSGDSLELLLSTMLELEVGSLDRIADCTRDQDCARFRKRGHAGPDVNGDSAHGSGVALDFPMVNARSDLERELAHRVPYRGRAEKRQRRAGENC